MELGSLPGTVRTATVIMKKSLMASREKARLVVSLEEVDFNENNRPARFSTLQVRSTYNRSIIVRQICDGDTIEEVSRWTAQRMFCVEIENLTSLGIVDLKVTFQLIGYPVSPVPKVSDFTRAEFVQVVNDGSVYVTDGKASPVNATWQTLP